MKHLHDPVAFATINTVQITRMTIKCNQTAKLHTKPLDVAVNISSTPYGCKMSDYVLLRAVKIYTVLNNK
jgi:hypothetical protein